MILMMEMESVSEILVYLNHPLQLSAQELNLATMENLDAYSILVLFS